MDDDLAFEGLLGALENGVQTRKQRGDNPVERMANRGLSADEIRNECEAMGYSVEEAAKLD